MSKALKISRKGQVTIPKKFRKLLGTDVVEMEYVNGNVVIKPVKSVAGALSSYAGKFAPFDQVRDKVWKQVADEKAGKDAS
ncbi:MAG: AbrB/MazE/SpoVT family DNA-binding domain-containing protein [Deltaproteobacteria bacterium]|nr:MAG: AbrB/MazE/SpoVT family DNA-binding domain-containing protein [Deltaproteobacteria bacterium]